MTRKTFVEPGVFVEPTLYFAGTDATDGTELWRAVPRPDEHRRGGAWPHRGDDDLEHLANVSHRWLGGPDSG